MFISYASSIVPQFVRVNRREQRRAYIVSQRSPIRIEAAKIARAVSELFAFSPLVLIKFNLKKMCVT